MNHLEKIARWLTPLEQNGGLGTEIGAFKTPIPGITPIYVDRFSEFAGEPCLADYFGDATELPFRDNSLMYVATSHVLEHVANPVAALAEWYRVLRPGGIIYLVAPDRKYTFDHQRQPTSFSHLIEDFENGTTPVDPTHIEDFVDGIDWSLYSPSTPPAEVAQKKAELKAVYFNAVSQGNEINIHFHVFEYESFSGIIDGLKSYPKTRFDWELVDYVERFPVTNPNGVLAVIRVKKSPIDRIRAAATFFRKASRQKILLRGAKKFPDRKRRSEGF